MKQPNNECGECRECCISFPIDSEDLKKPANTPCQHLCKAGCALHGTAKKPKVCQGFLCGWRSIPWLGKRPDYRPDKLGLMFHKGFHREEECCNILELRPGALKDSRLSYIKQVLRPLLFVPGGFVEVPHSVRTVPDYAGGYYTEEKQDGDWIATQERKEIA